MLRTRTVNGLWQRLIMASLVCSAMVFMAGTAYAGSIELGFIADPTAEGDTFNSDPLDIAGLEAQLSVIFDEGDPALGGSSFTFYNDVDLFGVSGTITRIEFQFSDIFNLTYDSHTDDDGDLDPETSYSWDVGNETAVADTPTAHSGVNSSEDWLRVEFQEYATIVPELLGALGTDNFNIRMHVQSISGPGGTPGNSDWFDLNPSGGPPSDPPPGPNDPPIPEPATMGLVGMGLAAVVLRRRSFRV